MPVSPSPVPQGRKLVVLPPLPARDYGAGGIEAYVPIPEPTAPPGDTGEFTTPTSIGWRLRQLPLSIQAQYSVRRRYADADVSDDDVLEGVLRAAEPRPSLLQRVLRLAGGVATAPGDFAYGFLRQIPATAQPGRVQAPDPRSLAEALGQGLAAPMNPNDPLVGLMSVPGLGMVRPVVTGYEAAAGRQALLGATRAVRTVRELPLSPTEKLERRGISAFGGAAADEVRAIQNPTGFVREAPGADAQSIITEAAGPRAPAPPSGGAAVPPPSAAPRLPLGGSPTLPPGRGGGGWRPPEAIPPGAVPPSAPVPSAIPQHLAQAKAIVERDRPGAVNRILDFIPGLRQAQRRVIPALEFRETPVGEQVLVAWNADGLANATVSTELQLGRKGQVALLEAAFGKGGTAVRDYKPAGVNFVGTAEQAQYPWLNTLYDILQRPSLYGLSAEQRNVITLVQQGRTSTFRSVKGAYGLDIGEFATPEGIHLPNVDVSEDAIEVAGSQRAALARGRAKERFYTTAADRWANDKTFRPETNVRALLEADDGTLTRMAGNQTFLEGAGGLTKLQVLEKTHPELAARMEALKKRLVSLRGTQARLTEKQTAAIDEFLASPLNDVNLSDLQADLQPAITKGPRTGKTLPDIKADLEQVTQELAELRPGWKAANTKPYATVEIQKNLYRYFPAKEAQQVRELLEVSHNPFWPFLDRLRQTSFGGDLSPASIQGTISLLGDPLGTGRWTAGGGLKVTEAQLARWAETHSDIVQRFTGATGINPLGGVQQEFATGFIADIPKVGKAWEAANEGIFRPLMMRTVDVFESSYQGGLRAGLTAEQAAAVGADDATKLIPRINFRRFGQSQAQAARYRAVMTSVSFLTQPMAMMNDATRGLLKVGLKQTLTRSERFAVQRVVSLAATTEALAVGTNVAYAEAHNLDVEQAVKDSLNPSSGKFMSLVLPNGGRIGLGGPYRSIITAITPRPMEVAGVESKLPVPFAGLYNFARNKVGPGFQVLLDEVRNRDYENNQIRRLEFPINILQGVAYALEGSLPLTAGGAVRDVLKGKPGSEVQNEALSQFLGTNYQPETLTALRNRIAVGIYPVDPKKEPERQRDPYRALNKTKRAKVNEDPLVKIAQDTYDKTHNQTDEFMDGELSQFYDEFQASRDLTVKRYQELGKHRQATIEGNRTGDDALGARQFREDLKDIAEQRRVTMADLIARFDKFRQEHDIEDRTEALPDEVERQKFLNEYFDPELLDIATGAWNYNKRADRKLLAEREWGAETVERWLSEGARETHPLVQGWWDGLETFRPYFEVKDELLLGAPMEVKAWVNAIQDAESQSDELGRAFRRMAPPEVRQFDEAVTMIKKAMRADTKRFPGLDRWLVTYGYPGLTLAEQAAREKE